jgi:hypothetical protein
MAPNPARNSALPRLERRQPRSRNLAAAILPAVLWCLPAAGAGATDTDPTTRTQIILDAQLKAFSGALTPDLRQSLAASQQAWTAFRDRQCVFERIFNRARDQRQNAADGPDAACVARFNQQRLQQLQEDLDALARLNEPPTMIDGLNDGGNIPKSCRLVGLPDGFQVHAVGIYAGTSLADVKIGDGWQETMDANVIVNKPGVPVALVLMAHQSVLWHVSWTPGTKIAAVIVGGRERQALLGIDKTTPLLLQSLQDPGPCGTFYALQANHRLALASAHIPAE